MAKRSKLSKDLGCGRGEQGSNIGGGMFFEACFFEMTNLVEGPLVEAILSSSTHVELAKSKKAKALKIQLQSWV